MRQNGQIRETSAGGLDLPRLAQYHIAVQYNGLHLQGKRVMSAVWNTKYGTRRVRHDPPTLKEAILAAQGLTDQLLEQVEIAAALMDMPVAEVRAELLKSAPPRKAEQIVTSSGRTPRTVVVERKPSRRIPAGAAPRLSRSI
ncbi:conserved protein of unknown function [Methylocella tundrae]|uniref:Uncharacterized protein n=2 Tax=Methylocella tundrae TaxID=227605 RepID=A0A4V6IN05_METTU|nr:conserved protein of unknown function [Methylocella tundrae]